MAKLQLTVRNARRKELPQLKTMCDSVAWNQNLESLQHFYDLNPAGNFVNVTDKGEVISYCGGVVLDDNTGYLAFYITKAAMRGEGVSRQVFDAVMNQLGDRNIGLDGSVAKEAMFAAGGFKIATFKKSCYQTALKEPLSHVDKLSDVDIVNLDDVPFEKIVEFDESFYPLPRSSYLQTWLSKCAGSYVATREGAVIGYGCLKEAAQGFRLAPLYANDAVVARMLWDALVRDVPLGTRMEVSVPVDNADAMQMFKDVAMTNARPRNMIRMFTHKDVPVKLEKVYSVCSIDSALA